MSLLLPQRGQPLPRPFARPARVGNVWRFDLGEQIDFSGEGGPSKTAGAIIVPGRGWGGNVNPVMTWDPGFISKSVQIKNDLTVGGYGIFYPYSAGDTFWCRLNQTWVEYVAGALVQTIPVPFYGIDIVKREGNKMRWPNGAVGTMNACFVAVRRFLYVGSSANTCIETLILSS